MLNPAGLLNDSIIDAAQKLLKQAFPALSGLQCVCRGLTMNFDIEPSEFIQVIHNGRGHWLTISMIGTSHPDVHVYDSMYPTAGSHVKTQTTAILYTESPAIHLQFMNVQMQAGGMTVASLLWHLLLHWHLESPQVNITSLKRKFCGAVLRE